MPRHLGACGQQGWITHWLTHPAPVCRVCWGNRCNPVLPRHPLLLGAVTTEAKSVSLKALGKVIFFSKCGLTKRYESWRVYSNNSPMEHDKNQVRRKHLRPCCHLSPPDKYFTRWHRSSLVYCCIMTQLQQLYHPPTLLTTAVYTQENLKGKKKGRKCAFVFFKGENRT